jgi:hypothetical protein
LPHKCDVCGAIEPLPFKCKRCGGTFCGDHRLPEKHYCVGKIDQNYTWDKPKNQSSTYSSQIKTYQNDNSYKKPYNQNKSKLPTRKIKRKIKNILKRVGNIVATVLAIVVTISFVGAIYFNSSFSEYLEPVIEVIQQQSPVYQKAIDSSYPNMTRCYVTEYRNATDPSYSELINFLRVDNTEKGLYVPGQHVCINFAVELHDNAERNQIKAHIFSIDFTYGESHACNGFNTTDRGWIYIDDTGYTAQQKATGAPSVDDLVNPIVGSPYIPKPLFPLPGNWIASQESMGTVSHIEQLC